MAVEDSLQNIVVEALEDLKARDVRVMDVRGLTSIADAMIVASGTSDRHVRSLAENVIEKCKESGHRPFGVEGLKDGEWVLVDLHDVVVHVMLPRVRDFYNLEKLWSVPADAGRVPVEA
ncbi:MAG: ribosome silencing factor [Gammaproteobacteria bacterium]|jgi:ribosome-associated protein